MSTQNSERTNNMKQITAIIATKDGFREYTGAQEYFSFQEDVEKNGIYKSRKGDLCIYETFEVRA